jgi:hypothetical protein
VVVVRVGIDMRRVVLGAIAEILRHGDGAETGGADGDDRAERILTVRPGMWANNKGGTTKGARAEHGH